jgi:anti-sigma B factor antagonist
MQDGQFPVELVSGVPVVTAPQEIDITNAPELSSALMQAAADGPGTLVADMSRTRFCDSSGLHTLLAAHKRAQAEGGELLLVIRSAAVLRIFALTTVDRMIPNFTSLNEALAHTSPNGLNGHRPTDDGPFGSATTIADPAAQHSASGPDAGVRAEQRPTCWV